MTFEQRKLTAVAIVVEIVKLIVSVALAEIVAVVAYVSSASIQVGWLVAVTIGVLLLSGLSGIKGLSRCPI